MPCINCGAPLENENDIFCEKCYKEKFSKEQNAEREPNDNHRPSVSKGPKKKKNKKKIAKIVLISVLAVILAAVIAVIAIVFSYLNKVDRDNLSGDLAIPSGEDLPFDEEIKNIAFYGLDSRKDNDSGRSDAILILTVDRKNDEIKLTSIARDTYVTFESGKGDKLTHAWAYGKAENAIKTLNRNFKLDITDYVSVNFFQFAEIIDYIGGVMVDVDSAEMKVMNDNYIAELNNLGIECEYIKQPGYQLLNGGQALAYSRNRYTGSDLTRGNRQREVLTAAFEKVKTMNKLKLPKLVDMVLSECKTTLSNSEMLSIGTWAMTKSPKIYSLGIPTKECNARGQMINGRSYMVYDLDFASNIIHDFVYNSAKEPVTSSALASNEK